MQRNSGFTLSELLIALAVLGIIATFAIPKVLQSQQDVRNNSIIKEVAGAVSGAYAAYKERNTVNGATGPAALIPYINYVNVDSASTIDYIVSSGGSRGCFDAGRICIRMHNGSIVRYGTAMNFASVSPTNIIWFQVDPDGTYNNTGAASSVGKSVFLLLYPNGRITSWGGTITGTVDSDGTNFNPTPANDPTWLSWN